MDKSLRRHGSDNRQSGGFFVNRQTFEGILHWLASFILLTEEEQRDAGIYLGDQFFRSACLAKELDNKEKT